MQEVCPFSMCWGEGDCGQAVWLHLYIHVVDGYMLRVTGAIVPEPPPPALTQTHVVTLLLFYSPRLASSIHQGGIACRLTIGQPCPPPPPVRRLLTTINKPHHHTPCANYTYPSPWSLIQN